MRKNTPWRDGLSVCADILQVTTFFGLTSAILIGGLLGVISFFSGVPHLATAGIAVTTGLATLIVLNVCTARRTRTSTNALPISDKNNTENSDFNLDDWVGHDTYLVGYAACLWVNMKPSIQIDLNSRAYPMLQKIKGALETEKIKSMFGGTGANAKLRKEELIKLANILGEKPRFLFPPINLTRDQALARLWELRKIGVPIRNEKISAAQVADWVARYEKWRVEVLDVAEIYNPNLRQRLEVLDRVRPPPQIAMHDGAHMMGVKIMSEILLRLEEELPR